MVKKLVPRPEYPRPILSRKAWQNLNGDWHYAEDPDDRGLTDRWYLEHVYNQVIVVPFPIESEASGVHNLSPVKIHWYEREFRLPADWNDHVLLHIGAVDHLAIIFINGFEVGRHRGGYTPINLDVTHALTEGSNRLTIRVEDDISWTQARGKQAGTTKWPIDYDTVTGIWQTVWIEPVTPLHIEAIHSAFDLAGSYLTVYVEANKQNDGYASISVLKDGKVVSTASKDFGRRAEAKLVLDFPDPELWSPKSPFLYEILITITDPKGKVDAAISYTGLREINSSSGNLQLNGEPLYIRGILDQGYFPGGWYTPLDDETIRRDVELTLKLGFNCVRKHQKIEDPRYLYWADQLGLLVWEEMPSGRVFSTELVTSLTSEWLEVMRRDRQHPCIIAWVPFNESWGIWNQTTRPEQRAFVDGIVGLTKALDQTRWVVGNDGWEYSSGDLWTLHIYEGESISLSERLGSVIADPESPINSGGKVGALLGADVSGKPILLTECGGIGYSPEDLSGEEFSYGDIPTTLPELELRFRGVANTIAPIDALQGFVWTQLTDVQQEFNGVLYFDRSPKLPIALIREVILGIGPIDTT
ncbi:MAG: beta-galactosidase/beta-glucuronidase [Candidatus Azotimanducaceae bacterium]|jgi:beta-galactosidase/beta-glucuronidase